MIGEHLGRCSALRSSSSGFSDVCPAAPCSFCVACAALMFWHMTAASIAQAYKASCGVTLTCRAHRVCNIINFMQEQEPWHCGLQPTPGMLWAVLLCPATPIQCRAGSSSRTGLRWTILDSLKWSFCGHLNMRLQLLLKEASFIPWWRRWRQLGWL